MSAIKVTVGIYIHQRICRCPSISLLSWQICNHGNDADLLNAANWSFTKISFCHNVLLNTYFQWTEGRRGFQIQYLGLDT